MGEWITGDNFSDQRLHPITILADIFQKVINDDLIITFNLTAKGVGEQFFGKVSDEVFLAICDDRLEFFWGIEFQAAGQFPACIDRSARIVLIPPATDGIEIFQPESDWVHDLVTVGADRISAVEFRSLA